MRHFDIRRMQSGDIIQTKYTRIVCHIFDNGIYILVTPSYPIQTEDGYFIHDHQFDCRVAHCRNIEDVEYNMLMMPLLFSDSPVFHDKDEAYKYACDILKDMENRGEFVEYGIEYIFMDHTYYPNITKELAKKILDNTRKGNPPLDVSIIKGIKTDVLELY